MRTIVVHLTIEQALSSSGHYTVKLTSYDAGYGFSTEIGGSPGDMAPIRLREAFTPLKGILERLGSSAWKSEGIPDGLGWKVDLPFEVSYYEEFDDKEDRLLVNINGEANATFTVSGEDSPTDDSHPELHAYLTDRLVQTQALPVTAIFGGWNI